MAHTGGPPATGIVTPEAVLLEFDTAGVASRVIAELIDLAVLAAGFVGAVLVLGLVNQALAVGEVVAVVAVLVLILFVLVGYPALLESLWGGRTLGKAAMGLRVVTREGAPVRFRHAAIRAMVGLVEIWVFLGLPAVVSIIVSRRDQRVGDLVAGTLVLRERTGHRASFPMAFAVPWNWESWVATLDVSRLTEEQYGVIRSFFTRQHDLSPDARWAVSVDLATRTADRLGMDAPTEVHPEMFLMCVATAYQRRGIGPGPAPS